MACLSEHMLLVAVGCRTLHRLSSLELLGDCFRPAELEQLMHHVSALTRLTQLRVSIHGVDADVIEAPGLAVCEHLATLTNFQILRLRIGVPDAITVCLRFKMHNT